MGDLVVCFLLFLVIAIPVGLFLGTIHDNTVKNAEKKYKASLHELEMLPNSPEARRKVIQHGREYYVLLLPGDSLSEARIQTDILASIAGATIGEGNYQKIRIDTGSLTDEINGQAELARRGVITADEFEIGKNNLLGNKTDKIDEKTKSLESLFQLKNQGVITEGEYNLKKWDILSKK